MEEIKEIEEFDFPREILISAEIKPVSLQANREKKDSITSVIRGEIRKYDFVYSGDVQIEIEWFIHQRKRYETHLAPDVDNIIKPILDALCGPEGVLINDCQVQFVSSHWIDWTRPDEKINIRISPLLPDECLGREGLIFIKFQPNLCFPIVKEDFPLSALAILVKQLEEMIQAREKLMGMNIDYYAANSVMPIQRFFHIMHVQDFPIIDIEVLKLEIAKSINEVTNS